MVEVVTEKDRTAVDGKKFWFGVLPGSPLQNIRFVEHTFHTYTESVNHKEGSLRTQRNQRAGMLLSFDDETVKRIEDKLDRCVVRVKGLTRPAVLDPKAKHKNPLKEYRPHKDDIPLGDLVYFINVDEAGKLMGPVALMQSYPLQKPPPSYNEMKKMHSEFAKTQKKEEAKAKK